MVTNIPVIGSGSSPLDSSSSVIPASNPVSVDSAQSSLNSAHLREPDPAPNISSRTLPGGSNTVLPSPSSLYQALANLVQSNPERQTRPGSPRSSSLPAATTSSAALTSIPFILPLIFIMEMTHLCTFRQTLRTMRAKLFSLLIQRRRSLLPPL